MPNGDPLRREPPFARFLEVLADPVAEAERQAAAGRRVIGLVCPNLPEELPHALGLSPCRVVVRPKPSSRAAEVLQTFACSWVKALLDQALDGAWAHLHGLVFPCNTCDSLQNVPDIWRHTVSQPGPEALFSLRFPVDVATAADAARQLLDAELAAWCTWLEGRAGCALDPDRLAASARLYNRIRAALRQLQALAGQGRIGYSLLQAAALSAQVMDREQVADLLDAAVERAAAAPPSRPEDAPRLVLAGGYLDDARLLGWLEQHNAFVVDDDTCALWRSFEPATDLDPADPLADIARRHLRRSRCPVQVGSGEQRSALLLQKVRQSDAQGVILLPYKGCEPHAFDNVLLSEALGQLEIPQITLEIEPHLGNWGQLAVRLEAFLEMISGLEADLFEAEGG
jgi:benzoyl-CoA reductase subunit C